MRTTNYNTEELEAKLLERFGNKTPFTVPVGYFDGLTGKVMSRIAQRKRRRQIWRWAAAAVLAGCVATGGLLFERQYNQRLAETEDIQYIEDALDYSMIDNMSIASYLTEAE
ncbi:MAG: hypothetical protein J6Y59_05805 [Bacteroidaceae bacterium]|nr:hypothetical protein [Bacteroidaceae bacterium]